MKKILFILVALCSILSAGAAPIDSLAMRVTRGTSQGRILFSETGGPDDFFEIKAHDGKVLIEGNNPVSLATGLNWYLKYVAGIHISWNNLTQALPEELPLPEETIRKSTPMRQRYYLNYCTFSYSMPFWDFDRWEKEIDWMALHGINMPLSLTGSETVWRNLLRKLGYSDQEIGEFISGPAYFAWWQMNNLEGWGGPLPDEWYERQAGLQRRIVERMHSLGIEPVLPGYAGMVPRNIGEKLGFAIADPGRWCGFPRPAFLSPSDPMFDRVADMYYAELDSLYGKSRYYSMDPFHEGGSTDGVDLAQAGRELMAAMKRANPDASWVIQAWQANPRRAMIDSLDAGSMVVLDLYSEKLPQWGDTASRWCRPDGFGQHDWLYCMLLNFGGNVGMHGRMAQLVKGYYDAREHPNGRTLRGVGTTPEGIENNPVMFELLYELPWRESRFDVVEWLTDYLTARYGACPDDDVLEAWSALRNTVYDCPTTYPGEGTVESLLCARPAWDARSASTWGSSLLFYDPDSTARAAALMQKAAPRYAGNDNFDYDLADIRRQAIADQANRLLRTMGEREETRKELSAEFLNLILLQDSMLSHRPEFSVDTWVDAAGSLASDSVQRELYRRNAARLVTVWGDSVACNRGGLHDYSHREWSGLLRDLYYKRWKAFFDYELGRSEARKPDFYRMECEWVDKISKN